MKPDIKKLWVDALRSGKYNKGRGYLKYPKLDGEIHYCCLGVLAELSPVKDTLVSDCYQFEAAVSYLGDDVMEWAGLDAKNPRVPWRGDVASLADINDNTDATFPEIADLIEAHL